MENFGFDVNNKHLRNAGHLWVRAFSRQYRRAEFSARLRENCAGTWQAVLMTLAKPLHLAVGWLRAGYPAEAPKRGYLPLVALCGRNPGATGRHG